MAIKPKVLARLIQGLAIGARRNKHFAETFNWMASWLGKLDVRDGLELTGADEGKPELTADVVKDLDVEVITPEEAESAGEENEGGTYLIVKYSKANKADKKIKMGAEIGNFRFDYGERKIQSGVICVGRTFIAVEGIDVAADYSGGVRCKYSFQSGIGELELAGVFQNEPDADMTYIPLYEFEDGMILTDYRGAPVIQSYEDV